MYTQSVKFEFLSTIPQSARLRFLSGMAEELEQTISENVVTSSHGFSMELDKNGKAQVVIWHPWKSEALFSQLRSGEGKGVIRVTNPKQFSTSHEEDNNA
jgi:hypothetical protein